MIHETAIISPKAQLGKDIQIGPYCIVGDHVTLGDRCHLHAHVVINGFSSIGDENEFFPFSAIGQKTQDLKYKDEPTFLEIGNCNVFRENVTIHRSTSEETVTHIGDHNLFLINSHVAHECQIANHVILSGYAGIAGHVVVDDYAIISGSAGVHQFCRIGQHSMVGIHSSITQDVPPFLLVNGISPTLRGVNQVGLRRRGFSDEDILSLRQAYKKIFLKKDQNLSEAVATFKAENQTLNPHVRTILEFLDSSKRGIIR